MDLCNNDLKSWDREDLRAGHWSDSPSLELSTCTDVWATCRGGAAGS